jgi:hypothetical protein
MDLSVKAEARFSELRYHYQPAPASLSEYTKSGLGAKKTDCCANT